MRLAIVAALATALLLRAPSRAGDRSAVPTVVPIVRVLDVSKVDKDAQQILFYQTAELRETVDKGGKKVVTVRPVTVAAAFSLKTGRAMTAAGKPLRPDEVLKRLTPGGSVAVMRDMGKPEEGEADPSLRYRKLFKDDTIFLIGELEAVK